MVRSEWVTREQVIYRTVIVLNRIETMPPKAFGVAIYAGPEPGQNSGPDIWQVWLGNGTTFAPITSNTNNPLPFVDFTKTNYVAVTYDGSTQLLNLYTYVAGIEMDNSPFNTVHDFNVSSYQPNTNPNSPLLIGMNQVPIGSGSNVPLFHPFKGRIQEVAIYSKALTFGRIVSHIGAGLNL